MPNIGVYPGSFDPLTFGHMDIIRRAARLVETLVIGVGSNTGKASLFSAGERVKILARELETVSAEIESVILVETFDGLLVDFAEKNNAGIVFRGLRSGTDFDYEFQMVSMNAAMKPEIETVFLMASPEAQMIAASLVREIAQLGGDVSPFVPPGVAKDIRAKLER